MEANVDTEKFMRNIPQEKTHCPFVEQKIWNSLPPVLENVTCTKYSMHICIVLWQWLIGHALDNTL